MKKTTEMLAVAFLSVVIGTVGVVSASAAKVLSRPVIETVQIKTAGIRLGWCDDSESERTAVYRKEKGENKFDKIATVEKDFYLDKTAVTGVEYVYRIKSLAGKGKNKLSSKRSENVIAVTYRPEKTENITATHKGTENLICLYWDAASGADKYLVYRSDTQKGKYKKIALVTENSFEDTRVENNRYYYYKIRSVNSDSGKDVSGAFSAVKKAGSMGKANYRACESRVYALKNVKIRKSASSSAKVVAVLKKGYGADRVAESDEGWTKVRYNNKTAYIKSSYLTQERVFTVNKSTGREIVDPGQENWNLVIVNHSKEIPEGYTPALDEIFDTGYYLEERVTPYYEKMYKAALKDGFRLKPRSAYRSYEKQKKNYDALVREYMSEYGIAKSAAKKTAARTILPPGTSEHHLGLAIDIISLEYDFVYSKEYKWLEKNAHKYGFILRYTAEKAEITGIVPEPWHWRFVGVEYAEKIRDSGLCLEEYLEAEGIFF